MIADTVIKEVSFRRKHQRGNVPTCIDGLVTAPKVTAGWCETCRKKKQELKKQGRTEDEVKDRTLFVCCDRYEDVEAVIAGGLHCGMKFLNSCLGQFHDDRFDVHISTKRQQQFVVFGLGPWRRRSSKTGSVLVLANARPRSDITS